MFLAHWFLSPWWWRWYVHPKLLLLQEPHDITSQKTIFFRVTAVKISNLTKKCYYYMAFPKIIICIVINLVKIILWFHFNKLANCCTGTWAYWHGIGQLHTSVNDEWAWLTCGGNHGRHCCGFGFCKCTACSQESDWKAM
jgi:hypothetical protein